MAVKPSVRVVKDQDNGFDNFFKTMKGLGRESVKVGIQSPESQETGAGIREGNETNLELAIKHEFGVPEENIPERSFIRSTTDKEKSKIESALVKVSERALKRRSTLDAKSGLLKTGEFLRKSIVTRMDNNEFGREKPLSSFTIQQRFERTGVADPVALVDTAVMKNSITAKLSD